MLISGNKRSCALPRARSPASRRRHTHRRRIEFKKTFNRIIPRENGVRLRRNRLNKGLETIWKPIGNCLGNAWGRLGTNGNCLGNDWAANGRERAAAEQCAQPLTRSDSRLLTSPFSSFILSTHYSQSANHFCLSRYRSSISQNLTCVNNSKEKMM